MGGYSGFVPFVVRFTSQSGDQAIDGVIAAVDHTDFVTASCGAIYSIK